MLLSLPPQANKMQQHFAQNPKRDTKGISLSWALIRAWLGLFIWQGIFLLVATLLAFVSPLALKQLTNYISNYQVGDEVPSTVYLGAGLLFVSPLITALANGQQFQIARRLIFRYRTAIIALVFRHTLRLDMSAASFSVGRITNLCAIDANCADAAR